MEAARQSITGFAGSESQPTGVSATPGPRGSARSCLTCAKAKAKCVKVGTDVCERCTRLRKECQMKELVQRRRKPTKLSRTAQLENLENKLENLVHALSAQQARQQQQSATDNGHPSPPESHAQSDRGPNSVEAATQSAHSYDEHQQRHCQGGQSDASSWEAQCGTPAAEASSHIAKTDGDEPPLGLIEAEALYERYTTTMAPMMPFVVLPPNTHPALLAHEKPFLMCVISTVAMYHDLPRQRAMGKSIMRQISEKMLIRGIKSMELLQGILIYLFWYHTHIFESHGSNLLLHLAMALVSDLDIDRAPCSCEKSKVMAAAGFKPVRNTTNEERRALLGVYYTSTMISTSFKKIDPMKWHSTWMPECLRVLEQSPDCESDILLVQLVRTGHLMEEAAVSSQTEAPTRFYARALQGDLERITIPPQTGKMHDLVLQQQAVARILVWEQFFVDPLPSNASPSELRQRLDAVWSCVEAIRVWIRLYLAIPVEDYLSLPFQVFGQFAYVFMTMLRMSTLEIPGWDVRAYREQLDFGALMDVASDNFEKVEKCVVDGTIVNNDAFTRWGGKIRWMKNFYESKMVPEKSQQPEVPVPEPGNEGRDGAELLRRSEGMLGKVGIGPQQHTPQDIDLYYANNAPMTAEFFTYFDDAFWNSFNPNELDFEMPIG